MVITQTARHHKITRFVIVAALSLLAIVIFSARAYAAPATQANPANSKAAADCRADQDPRQIGGDGPNKGKWFCQDKSNAGLGGGQAVTKPLGKGVQKCGGGQGNESIDVSINIGCKGRGNPIADMTFAIIRVLSLGVGLVVIGSIIVGGIQYSASRGDPQATALAINRIRSSLIALFIYIFAFAFLNYIIPGQFLQ